MSAVDYWNTRYKETQSSGTGSRGAEAKAKVAAIKRVITTYAVKSILDLGCGDGYVAERLPTSVDYLGFDPSSEAIMVARARGHQQFTDVLPTEPRDLVLSCDVLFHLPDDGDYAAYMAAMFRLASRFIFVWSSNHDQVGKPHVRDRRWTDDIPRGWRTEDHMRVPFDQKYMWLLARELR